MEGEVHFVQRHHFLCRRGADAGHGGAGQPARLALVNKGVKVQAVVAGTIQNRDGVSLALAFTTPSGDTRRLPYPVPRKAKGLRQGSQVTLYYDPDHPEKVYVEGDKAVLGAEMIYYVLAGLLLALGLVLLVML